MFGKRLIVNGGTSVYGTGPERQRQRSTAAHSTVEISSEVWAGFRVARRAKPIGLNVTELDGILDVSCAHDGYHRLEGAPTHRRSWRLEQRTFTVRDRIEGRHKQAVARFALAPNCQVRLAPGGNGHVGTIQIDGGGPVSWQASAPAKIAQSTWHPEFGLSVPNSTMVFPVTNSELSFELNW